ncbi:Autoinducer 2 sensor kinase/phosphatase LuxQ [Caulifigura coniformis]|uniref:histidine kinase n=1 Tax=Caulifigura coniformis TaxID=2527983 RepID=A0A517S8F4_9PLAN|nr:ATP-binding protein [Caulifigura coniformis]QDT52398.1 Autoinducer 2 sensor kinase/phosphatase LuxQ [Caulifigura coniformis]
MQLLNRLSISRKLTLFGAVTSVLALSLMAMALAMYDIRNIQQSIERFYGALAGVVGEGCKRALEDHDPNEALKALQVITKDPSVISAELRDAHDRLVVEFAANPVGDISGQSSPLLFGSERLIVSRPVRSSAGVIGQVRLHVTADRLWAEAQEHMLLILCVTLAGILISALLAGYLQRQISAPVLNLVHTARAISETGDYSRRAHRHTFDEFGQMCDEFNNMLIQIENRDAELALHRRHLEDLVRLRTEALEQKTREALAASVAKSQFLANMSHEIRTPMNGILGFADLLRRGVEGEDEKIRKDYLDIISTSGKHLLTVINDVLDLSKIEAGRLEVECIPCSPHQVICEATSVLKIKAAEKGLQLNYRWEGPAIRAIESDPSRLRQLLINLVGNAVKFTERGAVNVTGRLVKQHGAYRLQVSVQDTGIGIPADQLEEIFNPFAQADASVTRRFGGTGLGLAISRHIAEALGGSIEVASQPSVGSTFTVTIDPGHIDQALLLDQPPAIETASPAPEADTIVLAPGRVLVVEDGETNRKLIRIMLERHGLEISEATNGIDGVRMALSGDFDIVLMDMQMPLLDGYSAASQIRSAGSRVPIIALTAHAMSGDEEKCLAAGCSGYMTKPIDETRLLKKLSEFLQRSVDVAATRQAISGPTDGEQQPWIHSTLPIHDIVFRQIVCEFVTKLETRIKEMRRYSDAEQWTELAAAAHWLKGSGGTAGFNDLTAPSSRLERAAKEGNAGVASSALSDIEALTARLRSPELFNEAIAG